MNYIFLLLNCEALYNNYIISPDNSDAHCCVSALEMLWSCPILEDVDLDTLEKCVLNHDFPYLAALLLPFMRTVKRTALIQVFFFYSYGGAQYYF